jgi:hypothetical protein
MERPSLIPSDTDPEADAVQMDAYRRMGGPARSATAFRLIDMARRNAVSGIRQRHPEYDDAQVRSELCRLRLGDTLWRLLEPGDERPRR